MCHGAHRTRSALIRWLIMLAGIFATGHWPITVTDSLSNLECVSHRGLLISECLSQDVVEFGALGYPA
jgi:hypothetical protein